MDRHEVTQVQAFATVFRGLLHEALVATSSCAL